MLGSVTAFEHDFWARSDPDPEPVFAAQPAAAEPAFDAEDSLADALPDPANGLAPSAHVGLELSEKLQRLLDAVDSLDDGGFEPTPLAPSEDQPVIEGDALTEARPESALLHPVEPRHETLPEPADQAPSSLIIRYDAGVELRFSGQSALFLERLLRVSADLDALARALPTAGTGEPEIAEPPAR
jgi:hypothetical protein